MTTLLVATTGGHLAQLHDLVPRLLRADEDRVWITNRAPQSESLLADEDVLWVRELMPRDHRGVLRSIPHAHRVLRERKVTRAISTGSAIALGYLPYLAARGVSCHFIESAARVDGPSMSGRVLQHVPRVRCYTQYRHRETGGWMYRGSVFDGFERAEQAGPVKRVLVTVGASEPFRALVEKLVPLLGPTGALAAAQGFAPEVLWQTGRTEVDDLGIEATPFLPATELEQAIADADLVVSHAGVGSAMTSLRVGRCPVLVPRRHARGEAVDDHQLQIAASLADLGVAVRAEVGELGLDHLLHAASSAVVRRADPPAFVLEQR